MEVVPVATTYFPSTPDYYPFIAVVTILTAIYYYMQTSRTMQLGNKIPGPRTVPFIGNALLTIGVSPKDVLPKLLEYDVYGNVIRAFMGTKLVIFLKHPRDIEVILSSPVHIDKSPEYRHFKPWLGEGLLISSGEKWKTHRKIIAPTFHLNVLKSFVPLFYENSRDLVIRFRKYIGKEFDCHDYLSAVTVDILLETAMGVRGREKQKTGYEYAMAVMKMCEIVHRRQYHALLRFDSLFKWTNFAKQQTKLLEIIHGLTKSVIHKKKEQHFEDSKEKKDAKANGTMQNILDENHTNSCLTPESMHYVRDDLDEIDDNDVGEKKRLAFLDLLLEFSRNGTLLTDDEIKEEVDTIMFEGHDTTAAGSSFVLCILGIHQNVQERVYEELYEIFKDSDRQCTFQDTLQMKYLERVIMETLRLYPPVPAIARLLKEDVTIRTGNYVLPKGCTVIIPPYKVHRLPEFYEDPETFNPDNFLPEKMQMRHYYSYIPFSAGPRSCVGRKYAMLKLKVLLSTILRNYRILSDLTEKDFRLQVDIILKRVDGFKIKIEPRKKREETVQG